MRKEGLAFKRSRDGILSTDYRQTKHARLSAELLKQVISSAATDGLLATTTAFSWPTQNSALKFCRIPFSIALDVKLPTSYEGPDPI